MSVLRHHTLRPKSSRFHGYAIHQFAQNHGQTAQPTRHSKSGKAPRTQCNTTENKPAHSVLYRCNCCRRITRIQGKRGIWFCGPHQGYIVFMRTGSRSTCKHCPHTSGAVGIGSCKGHAGRGVLTFEDCEANDPDMASMGCSACCHLISPKIYWVRRTKYE